MSLLKEALVALGQWDDALGSFVNEEFFSRLVGTFELNNIGIQMRSPLKVAIDAALAADGAGGELAAKARSTLEDIACAAQQHQHDHDHDHDSEDDNNSGEDGSTGKRDPVGDSGPSSAEASSDDDDDDDDDSAAGDPAGLGIHGADKLGYFDGTGLYSLACMMNHSCLPSVKVLYPEDGRGAGVARVVALSGLRKGEEVLHSYLDEKWPFPRRRRTLERSYGFVCACERCTAGQ